MDLVSLKSFAKEARSALLKIIDFKIDYVLDDMSPTRRENPKAVKELENKLNNIGKEQVVEQVSYTWFNRFVALQYMDINGFNPVMVIMNSEGKTRPEILSEAIGGEFNRSFISEKISSLVTAIIDGSSSSNDPEKEAYRLLLVAVCNSLHSKMPFLFEKIEDYTEILMPDDLLSSTSLLSKLRNVMTLENCTDVEVIGWLYQFYISEKKDQVSERLKKNNFKITPENIPAATQLFTPHWIVKYLVENSLGRLWMLNNPKSNLINKMEFYIKTLENENEFIKIISPEEIKICDPACGSGHMLSYSFDLLFLIYQEEGYDINSIPSLILKNNLYGIELDPRAAELSSFALIMKARKIQKNFLNNPVQPNICILDKVIFKNEELNNYMIEVGRNLFTNPFQLTLRQFENSDNFGSLIKPYLVDFKEIEETIQTKNISGNLFLNATHQKVLKILKYSEYLSKKYNVVISNPPYMGGNGMNNELVDFAKKEYPDSKSDLFAMFMERSILLTINNGMMAMINMQSWMFLSSYEKLRKKTLANQTLLSMAHIGENGFDSIGGAVVSTTAFVLQNKKNESYKCNFLRLIDGKSESEKSKKAKHIISGKHRGLYEVSSKDFYKIPGSPIAYWISKKIFNTFLNSPLLENIEKPRQGATTSNNKRFLRYWSEVSFDSIGLNIKNTQFAKESQKKWFPYNKGGKKPRRWYGNHDFIINYFNDGEEIKDFHEELNKRSPGGRLKNQEYYFNECISWSKISTSSFGVRYFPEGFIFDVAGSSIFFKNKEQNMLFASLLNSKVITEILNALSPTLNFEAEHLCKIPIIQNNEKKFPIELLRNASERMISISKNDWDSYETSWNFLSLPLLSKEFRCKNIKETYLKLRKNWQKDVQEMIELESRNNQIVIDAYDLESEINFNFDLKKISLNCNPNFRYGENISDKNKEEKLLMDTLKEFISYSVGCMFGRYSVDKDGLILANQGLKIEDYLKRIPNPLFLPDDDNVIPILELDWFEDDITSRFKKFLRLTFGDESFDENIRFIENSIGHNIRKYFQVDFYKDHIQMYKKRPIYWLFSSPKGSFNALIYIHRYTRDTLSILLEKYLREFLMKLRSKKNTLERIEINQESKSLDKNKASKEIQKINSIIIELQNWDREIIFPLASQRLEINLDDGVKDNYTKFGIALKKVSGLS